MPPVGSAISKKSRATGIAQAPKKSSAIADAERADDEPPRPRLVLEREDDRQAGDDDRRRGRAARLGQVVAERVAGEQVGDEDAEPGRQPAGIEKRAIARRKPSGRHGPLDGASASRNAGMPIVKVEVERELARQHREDAARDRDHQHQEAR